LLDWEHEVKVAGGLWRHMQADLRAVGAICRALCGVIADGNLDLRAAWLARRVLMLGVPVVLVLAWQPMADLATLETLSGRARLEMLAVLLLQAVPVALPLALFVAVALRPPQREVRALRTGVLTCVGLFVLMVWAIPESNQAFRTTAVAALSGVSRADATLARGMHELTVAELATRAMDQPLGGEAGLLLMRSGIAVGAIPLIALGSAIGSLSCIRRRWWVAAVLVVCVAGLPMLANALRDVLSVRASEGLAPWLVTPVLMIATRYLRPRSQTPMPPTSVTA
jgi:hypothetical protein